MGDLDAPGDRPAPTELLCLVRVLSVKGDGVDLVGGNGSCAIVFFGVDATAQLDGGRQGAGGNCEGDDYVCEYAGH